jgi:hypothetical protein
MPRGQREELSPRSRTKRRGDAASALAGIQATQTHASRPSSCFRVSSVASTEAAGPASSALRQIASARPLRKVLRSRWRFGAFCQHLDRRAQRRGGRRHRASLPAPAGPAGGSRRQRRKRRIGRQNPQPAFGQSLERPAVPAERREAPQPRLRQAATTMSASAAAAWPSRVVTVRTPWTKCRSMLASARRARK